MQLTKTVMKALLKEHLLRREWEEYSSPRLSGVFDLVFKDGRNVVGLKIAEVYTYSQAKFKEEVEAIMLEMLRAGSGKVDKIYIAVPASVRLAMLPPAHKFKKAGIGLLLVEENGNVEERVIARPLRSEVLEEELTSLLTSLKASVYSMERRIQILEQEIKERLDRIERKLTRSTDETVPY